MKKIFFLIGIVAIMAACGTSTKPAETTETVVEETVVDTTIVATPDSITVTTDSVVVK
ncbi:MAG: hypothetical protein ACK5JD_02415 [Mangrovibacterium sp.]